MKYEIFSTTFTEEYFINMYNCKTKQYSKPSELVIENSIIWFEKEFNRNKKTFLNKETQFNNLFNNIANDAKKYTTEEAIYRMKFRLSTTEFGFTKTLADAFSQLIMVIFQYILAAENKTLIKDSIDSIGNNIWS